jgi:DNA-binding NtrC family response regulator
MRVTFASTPAMASAPQRPTPVHLPQPQPAANRREDLDAPTPVPGQSNPVLRRGPKLSTDEERAQIEAALQACGGNQTRAAKMLGIGRRTLINRVKEFGLARPRAR